MIAAAVAGVVMLLAYLPAALEHDRKLAEGMKP